MALRQVLSSFPNKRVLIIGDVMLDTYIWGSVDRISPESPVPVVAAKKIEHRLGGAANVALNVKALGATPRLLSVVGDDDKGESLIRLLEQNGVDSGGILKSPARMTTEKTRVLSRNQQMLRVDHETTEPLLEGDATALINKFSEAIRDADVVIFQDYDKGVLTEPVITQALRAAQGANVPTAVDPKHKNFFSYESCTLFKPNLRELSEALSVPVNGDLSEKRLRALSTQIRDKIKNAITLITLSDQGIYYHDDHHSFLSPAYQPRQVADVSGAGDTVIAVAGLCLASKADPKLMCIVANTAAALACEKVGVVPVDLNALRSALNGITP